MSSRRTISNTFTVNTMDDPVIGPRGKMGRFYYYAGEWVDFASTDSFLVNDAQAPFFHYHNNYWVFNPETNGTYTKQNMGTPSSSSSNWDLMTSDFKYIITEAIFGSYAHFGSAIINGDWMLSQHGTRNGVASTEYTKFDPNYPNTDHTYQDQSHNFIPNYCVDLLTGETYQQNAHVTGEIRATGGTIGGFIVSSTQIRSDNNNIILNSNGTATITGTINATNGSITGQMNIGTGGSIIVGSDNSGKYRIKISQNSSNGQISMIDSSGNSMVLINYNTDRSAGQITVSEGNATHPRYTFINPNAIESMYNYKNENNQWNGDSSHITTQLGYRMAETEYQDNYVSGGSGSTKLVKIGITSGVVSLRAYDENSNSAWPIASVPMNSYPSMTKGLVHVISLGSLKDILDNQTSYSLAYGKISVMLVQTS